MLDTVQIKRRLAALDPQAKKDEQTILWFAAAVILWMTDSLHGINIAWTTIAAAMLMTLPFGGAQVTPEHWKEVPLGTLIYLTAASAVAELGQPREGPRGMYTERDNLRLPLPVTVSVRLVVLLMELLWWRLLGILICGGARPEKTGKKTSQKTRRIQSRGLPGKCAGDRWGCPVPAAQPRFG